MIFTPTDLPGVIIVSPEPSRDERGTFSRLFCPDEFDAAGIKFQSTQVNLSTNRARHTLRGLHFQHAPYAEAKLVRCIEGSVWDVALDLRAGPTFGKWQAFQLDAASMDAVFLPEGIAHGFLTLADNSTLLYQMGRSFVPGHSAGVRWDDPDLNIDWPASPSVISQNDRELPLFKDVCFE